MLFELSNPLDQQRAHRAWLETLARDAPAQAVLLDGVVGQRRFVVEARGYEGALEAALYSDAIPPTAVARLVETTRDALAPLRRYHRLRARAFGLQRYAAADRFFPLAEPADGIDFDEARGLIVASARELGPEVQELLESAFADRWIDAAERPRKASKSKLSPVLGEHPYVVVTFDGTTLDLLNLAHELGHAVHRVMADRAQPWVTSRYSSLTAETVASVHELVLIEYLFKRAESPVERVASGMIPDPADAVDGPLPEVPGSATRRRS